MDPLGAHLSPLNIGLIGLGRHGLRYASHLMEPLPGAVLTAVCRRHPAKGPSFGEDHVRAYSDFRGLIDDPRVEAVVVVTPPVVSPAICREALRARKPVLVEKPLAISGQEARELVEEAAAADVLLMTAQTLRFDASIQMVYAREKTFQGWRYLLLINRLEPRPEGVGAQDCGGRGVLLEIGVHLTDLARFLTGDEVRKVWCDLDTAERGVPENRAWAKLWMRSGLTCLIDVSRVSCGRLGRVDLVGEQGQMIAEWTRHRFTEVSEAGVQETSLTPTPTVRAVLTAFIQAVQRHVPPPVTGYDGQRAVEIIDACYQAAWLGRPVSLD